MAKLAPTSHML